MKTRQARLDPLHVAALNLIDLEFFDCDKVRSAYKNYAGNLNAYPTQPDDMRKHEDAGYGLFLELLREIAQELGYSFDKDDLHRLGYLPTRLGNHHNNTLANAQLLREVLEGERPIPISNYAPNDGTS